MKKILLLLIMFGLVSCKDRQPYPNVLPEATQNGANTAGALVDGKVWVATTNSINYPGTHCSQVENKTKIDLDLRKVANMGSNSFDISALIENFELNKTYILSDDPTIGGYNYAIYINNEGVAFLTNSNHSGKIKITRLDLHNQIVSGTFEFKAVDKSGNVVNVTEGRFDKKFD